MIRTLSVAAALCALLTVPCLGGNLSGPARVVDGDTLNVAGVRVRLDGIDAPESKQRCLDEAGQSFACGETSRRVLTEVLKGKQISCTPLDKDLYGRTIARCCVGRADIGEALVDAGFAFAYRRYSMRYVQAENRARQAVRGFWKGSFDYPWDWRHAQGN